MLVGINTTSRAEQLGLLVRHTDCQLLVTLVRPAALDAFLAGRPNLGPKWRPSFVRVTGELQKLASMKVDKLRLRQDA